MGEQNVSFNCCSELSVCLENKWYEMNKCTVNNAWEFLFSSLEIKWIEENWNKKLFENVQYKRKEKKKCVLNNWIYCFIQLL